mgnify:CR=1 FL=1
MNEQDRLNGEYLTGWEIVLSILMFIMVIGLTYFILLLQ